jgi:hypothetical protein
MVNDPIGTVYTLLSFPSGSITGPFASVTLSGSLGNLVYGSNSITVQKTSALPLTWGNFTATPDNGKVIPNWKTLQENNTSHFVIDHAIDNKPFTAVGTIAAAGNSNIVSFYSFTHTAPERNTLNYYRFQQVDKDAHYSYSGIHTVQLADENANAFLLYPNPVSDILQPTMYGNAINTPGGKEVYRLQLTIGMNKINMGHFTCRYVLYYYLQKAKAVRHTSFDKIVETNFLHWFDKDQNSLTPTLFNKLIEYLY